MAFAAVRAEVRAALLFARFRICKLKISENQNKCFQLKSTNLMRCSAFDKMDFDKKRLVIELLNLYNVSSHDQPKQS